MGGTAHEHPVRSRRWLRWGLTLASTALFATTGINPILLLGLGAGVLLLVGS